MFVTVKWWLCYRKINMISSTQVFHCSGGSCHDFIQILHKMIKRKTESTCEAPLGVSSGQPRLSSSCCSSGTGGVKSFLLFELRSAIRPAAVRRSTGRCAAADSWCTTGWASLGRGASRRPGRAQSVPPPRAGLWCRPAGPAGRPPCTPPLSATGNRHQRFHSAVRHSAVV